MGKPDPLVDFDSENRDVSIEKWRQFWDSTDSWLAERGYTLYEYGDEWNGKPRHYCAPKHPNVYKVEHPFSVYGGDTGESPVPPLSAPYYHRVSFAQDSLDRHVVLKLMKDGSQEYRIARLLSKESSLFSLDTFNGILPPLDFLQLGNHWILIMPRWGSISVASWFSTVREVLDFMRYMLRALVLLHKNRIVHRDINISNCVVNHFCTDTRAPWNKMRKELGRDGQLVYAMIDFDIAIMFPPNATSAECRLPHSLSWDGNYSHPNDTMQGELDYDPFAFDVGCLGVEFCHLFQHLTPMVPMLAPLMDQMTRRDISRRFTASQSLEFFESFAGQVTLKVLRASPPPYCYAPYDQYNRWRGLPEIFCRDWAHFWESQPPYQIRLLRHICERSWGLKFVQAIRKLVRLVVLWRHGSMT